MLYFAYNLRNANQNHNGIFLIHYIGKCFKRFNAARIDRYMKQAPITLLVGI